MAGAPYATVDGKTDEGTSFYFQCAIPGENILCPVPAIQYTTTALLSDSSSDAFSFAGTSVASSGNVIAVGNPQYDVYQLAGSTTFYGNGSVTLYECSSPSSTINCAYAATIMPPTSDAGNLNCGFGWSVALINNGQTLIVGAPYYGYDPLWRCVLVTP